MGSHVISNRLATAFKTSSGETYFVLFAEDYDKKDGASCASWSCRAIGQIEAIMQYIFRDAASCEGGMLQGPSGHITPEFHIQEWLRALRTPSEMPDLSIVLNVGDSWKSEVPRSALCWFEQTLNMQGCQDLVQQLQAGQAPVLSLHTDAPLLARLYCGHPVAPWRIIKQLPRGARTAPERGYRPDPAPAAAETPPAFKKVGQDFRLIQRKDGVWFCGGWQYQIVGEYVAGLWESELPEPESSGPRIAAYRAAIRAAEQIPEGTRIRVDLSVHLEDERQRHDVQRMAENPSCVRTECGYEIAVPDHPADIWQVCTLPTECTTWLIPEQACAGHSPNSFNAC